VSSRGAGGRHPSYPGRRPKLVSAVGRRPTIGVGRRPTLVSPR